jgi:hypothetical protein
MCQDAPASCDFGMSGIGHPTDTSPTTPMIVLDAANLFHPPANSGAESRVESENG